jgi:hypothetical protein
MKLADVAISLSDVLSCIPWISENCQLMKVGPGDMLGHLAEFLASIRGNINPRMQVLQEKLLRHSYTCSPDRPIQDYAGLLPAKEYDVQEDVGSQVIIEIITDDDA